MRDYKKIQAYQLAEEMVYEVYKLTRDFPKEELYGLISQVRRAAVSISSNIAEGASRQHKRDYLNFLYVARGSLAELECLLNIARKLGYGDDKQNRALEVKFGSVARTLFGLISSVEKEV
jgi:four helix bundle protein